MSETNDPVRFQLRLQKHLHERLYEECAEKGISMNNLINQIIFEHLYPTPVTAAEHISDKVGQLHASLVLELQELIDLRKAIQQERELLKNL